MKLVSDIRDGRIVTADDSELSRLNGWTRRQLLVAVGAASPGCVRRNKVESSIQRRQPG